MQIPELSSREIENAVKQIKNKSRCSIFWLIVWAVLAHFKTKRIVNQQITVEKSTGIHTHDNMGKALENSITAINNSINWVDCTVT